MCINFRTNKVLKPRNKFTLSFLPVMELHLLVFAEHWNWDTWTGEGHGEEEEYDVSQPHCEDEGFVVSFFILENTTCAVFTEKRNMLIRRPPVE